MFDDLIPTKKEEKQPTQTEIIYEDDEECDPDCPFCAAPYIGIKVCD